ncbi:DegT/DnrJ/EryC1/StrS family aminotransferase [bacterium]|nr:DegT/DnrJ/EryC1/StrS family aminotransferase [bacterium]
MAGFVPDYQIGSAGFKFGKLERKYVNEVLKSHRLSYGPWSQKFEKIFSKEHECDFAVLSNSGTSALHMALAAMKEKYGWSDGDEVIMPAVTFVASANIIFYNNLKPVFVDVDPQTYNIDPSLIESAVTDKTRAILAVHLFGMPADMDPIMALAKKYDLRVLEDSCECMFASYKGKRVGSFGDVGCFSTYIAHFLVTGVGGLATTNDPDLAVIMRSYMNHGRDSIYLNIDADKGLGERELEMVVAKRFSFVRFGHSMRITELEAAIGVAQFEGWEQNISSRKKIANFYSTKLRKFSSKIQLPLIPNDCDNNFMMFPIVLKHEKKDRLVNFLEKNNIETRDMVPLTNQPVYRKVYGEDLEDQYPVAKWLNESGFYIGSHPYLKAKETKYVVEKISEYLEAAE